MAQGLGTRGGMIMRLPSIVTPTEAREYINTQYGVDLHGYADPTYQEVNEDQFFLALTCIEMAKRSLQAVAQGDYLASRIRAVAEKWRPMDLGYIDDIARSLRDVAVESKVCLELLRLAINPFLPEEQ